MSYRLSTTCFLFHKAYTTHDGHANAELLPAIYLQVIQNVFLCHSLDKGPPPPPLLALLIEICINKGEQKTRKRKKERKKKDRQTEAVHVVHLEICSSSILKARRIGRLNVKWKKAEWIAYFTAAIIYSIYTYCVVKELLLKNRYCIFEPAEFCWCLPACLPVWPAALNTIDTF